MLAAAFTKFGESHARKGDWSIVFVSSDKDQEAFDDYFKVRVCLPLCLP